MAWERVIIQNGIEISYENGLRAALLDVVTKPEADDWLIWKKQQHLEAGWLLQTEDATSFTVVRNEIVGKMDKIRTFQIREVA